MKRIAKLKEFQFVRFFIVGSTTFLVDFGLNSLIIFILNIDHTQESIFANIVSVPIAFVYNFTLSRKWTFKSSQNVEVKFIKFLAIGIFNYVVSTTLIGLLVSFLLRQNFGVDEIIIQAGSKLFVQAILMLWSFAVYKFWIFKD